MDEQDEILSEFLIESQENLDRLDQDLVALESEPDSRERLANIFRTVHTLKGTAGFLALHKLERIAHTGENLLSRLRDGELAYTPQRATALLEMVDVIRRMLANIEATGDEGKVDCTALIGRLDRLNRGPKKTEAVPPAVPPSMTSLEPETASLAQERVAAIPAVPQAFGGPTIAAAGPRASSVAEGNVRVDVRLLDTLMNLVGELVLARNQILQHPVLRDESGIQAASQRLDQITSELQDRVMKTRMQPIGTAWAKLPRLVRNLALACGKQMRFETGGADTELDRSVLEAIKDPLTHIVRNAVDHGIESPQQRAAAGKNPAGTLTLRAYHEGGKVILEITDDGGGIDAEKIKACGLERGLISPERAAGMTEQELQELIFLPGLSTADAVSNVSGRGVGMDVVKTNIEKIGGRIDIESRVGKGTSIKIRIPLTLAIVPALIVSSGAERYAIPQVNVLELMQLDSRQPGSGIEYVHSAPVYRLHGNVLPLVRLHEILALPRPQDVPAAAIIVVLQADDRQFGLVVDGVSDTQEIVVKPLGRELKGIPVFAGATIMGDGRVALILDVPGVALTAGLLSGCCMRTVPAAPAAADTAPGERQVLLQFEARGGACLAVPVVQVARLEEIDLQQIEMTGGQPAVQYRGGLLPLIRLDQRLAPHGARVPVVVYREGYLTVGFVVERVLDIIEEAISLQRDLDRDCLLGTAIVGGRVTDLFDFAAAVRAAGIDPYERRRQARLKEVA